MGMSASQARLLSLQAQLSNLEYQGQQINQARTVLSQQATALYNSLLSMTVPTPPATTDFQTVKYTGTLGATEYTFDANSIKPDGAFYSITMQEKAHGDSLQKNATVALVEDHVQGSLRCVPLNTTKYTLQEGELAGTNVFEKSDKAEGGYMVETALEEVLDENGEPTGEYKFKTDKPCFMLVGDKFVMVDKDTSPVPTNTYYVQGDKKPEDETKHFGVKEIQEVVSEEDNGQVIEASRFDSLNIYVIAEDGKSVRKATRSDFDSVDNNTNLLRIKKDVTYLEVSDNSQGTLYNVEGDIAGITVGGKGIHALNNEEIQTYGNAIANCGLTDANGQPYEPEDFYMYYDDKDVAVFVLKSDVTDGNNNATTYSYVANGEYTKNTTYDDVQLTFDPTNGRITEIAIPTYDGEGNVASWTSIPVSAETVTDEAAYEDAYNKYEYDTYLYDQKNKEINAKTEVIQQEDKNLELKLQRLDNERTQITTEIEAVEKVINDNIESSYKTFSG